MKRFAVIGPPGSGTTSVGVELRKRGYYVLLADDLLMSGWINPETGERAEPPEIPIPADWLKQYQWRWNLDSLKDHLGDQTRDTVFVCGFADNFSEAAALFDEVFLLTVDDSLLRQRLQDADAARWLDGSYELSKVMAYNDRIDVDESSTTYIDSSHAVETTVDEIISYLQKP